MLQSTIMSMLCRTNYIRTGGSPEEEQTAQLLKEMAESYGVHACIEEFPVQMAEIEEAVLTIDGYDIPCKGYKNCGSGEVEAPFIYLPNLDKASLTKAKDKIVMVDGGLVHFKYQDLLDNGALGLITYNGNINRTDKDIDPKELRSYVSAGRKVPCVSVHASTAVELVKNRSKMASIRIRQKEWMGNSRNVVAEIPGTTDQWICLSAHYDSTPLSKGSYDNMTGCIGLMGVMEALAPSAPHRYGLRFIFCGSEERGLLGSKAYVAAHEAELEKIALNINLDMIGSIMGNFIACCTAEESVVNYIRFLCLEEGWGIKAYQGVYSSDSTPFADKGIPAISFARLAGTDLAPIHTRFDTMDVLSSRQIEEDVDFITGFTRRMADAVVCPIPRSMPEKMKKKLDEYLVRKRPEE